MKRMQRSTLSALSLGLLLVACCNSALAAGVSYFPTAIGSSWSYNTQTLTMSGFSQVMLSGTEAVVVQSDGQFKATGSSRPSSTSPTVTRSPTTRATSAAGKLCI